jgi:hypothetical protein
MNPETVRLRSEFEDVVRRVRELVARVDGATLQRRPVEGSWSAAECIEHLSVSADKYAKRIARALESAERRTPRAGAKHTLWGRFFLWVMEPPVKRKLPAPPPFRPGSVPEGEALLAHFETAHGALAKLVDDTDVLDRTHVKVASPSSKYIHLSLLDAFAILASHGRRHVVQAERAVTG